MNGKNESDERHKVEIFHSCTAVCSHIYNKASINPKLPLDAFNTYPISQLPALLILRQRLNQLQNLTLILPLYRSSILPIHNLHITSAFYHPLSPHHKTHHRPHKSIPTHLKTLQCTRLILSPLNNTPNLAHTNILQNILELIFSGSLFRYFEIEFFSRRVCLRRMVGGLVFGGGFGGVGGGLF